MTIDSQGRKISNFPTGTTVPDGAYITFVSGSTNYKITKANFLTAMGATGTLTSVGSVNATPVLSASGSTYTIRALENGYGITCSVAADNGINVAVNMTQEGSYTPLVSSFSVASPVFASLKGGTGISLSKASNIITISATGALPYGLVTMQSNGTATTISGTAADVLAGGTWTAGATSNFTASTGGRLTYTGAETMRINVDASVTFTYSDTGVINATVAIARNGSVHTASKRAVGCDSVKASLSLPYNIEMAQNDYLELYVANQTTASNITVTDAIFRATR